MLSHRSTSKNVARIAPRCTYPETTGVDSRLSGVNGRCDTLLYVRLVHYVPIESRKVPPDANSLIKTPLAGVSGTGTSSQT